MFCWLLVFVKATCNQLSTFQCELKTDPWVQEGLYLFERVLVRRVFFLRSCILSMLLLWMLTQSLQTLHYIRALQSRQSYLEFAVHCPIQWSIQDTQVFIAEYLVVLVLWPSSVKLMAFLFFLVSAPTPNHTTLSLIHCLHTFFLYFDFLFLSFSFHPLS